MDVQSIEYAIYNNLFIYLDVIKFTPVVSDDLKDSRKKKKDFIKTMQFYSYVKIKAANADGEVMHILLLKGGGFVSKSMEFKKLLNMIPDPEFHLVIVSREGLKISVKKFLAGHDSKTITIKDLRFNHFKSDPRKNLMVPKHTLCSDSEAITVFRDNNIEDPLQFPWIKSTDTQVLWIGGKVGQLVKIERPSTIGIVLYYRIII